jgi:cation:H+ antiporter
VEIEAESLDDLYLGKVYDRTLGRISSLNIPDQSDNPHVGLVAFQSLLALGIIILGAHMFIDAVEWLSSDVLSLPLAVIALLLAPLATELPEKMNSVIWISRGKDVLALGNITGALVFQSTIPVVLGILFTSWNLSFNWGTVGFLNALSAILAIAGAFLIYVRVKYSKDGMLDSFPFLIGGILYLLFIIILVYHLMHFDLSIVSH